ncbi:MAG: hypothetical protein EOO47_21350, partial [Flavobacterium sp.]
MKKQFQEQFPPLMSKENFVYSRIGMALISAQRVEFIANELLNYLIEFDRDLYGITSTEFLEKVAKPKNGHKTLGSIFTLLKLNPKLVIEDELDTYLKKRNRLAHSFWSNFLQKQSDGKDGVDFCYDFGLNSNRIESFFKGFTYFLALRHVKDRDHLDPRLKLWSDDFDYFIVALKQNN